jgi:hypothetical protein
MTIRVSTTRRHRVITLLDAISNLHRGDLKNVLKLDDITPLQEFGPNAMFALGEGGKIIVAPDPSMPKSLKSKVTTGEELGRILENHLEQILSFGEAILATSQKERRGRNEIGGRRFGWN